MASCSDIPGRIVLEYVLPKDWGALPGHCQVDVFWNHVNPIRHTIPSQELGSRSRLGSKDSTKELPSRNILVHVITLIVKVHFTIYISVNRRRTDGGLGTLAPALVLKYIYWH